MPKTFVIAGTRDQFNGYKHRRIRERVASGEVDFHYSDYVYVNNPLSLRGFADPHGVFIGTWKQLPDIKEIVETLIICSRTPNPKLIYILNELNEPV